MLKSTQGLDQKDRPAQTLPMSYTIHTLTLPDGGALGIGPLPTPNDIPILKAWNPNAVITMTTQSELGDLDLVPAFGSQWYHMPIPDFGAPDAIRQAQWQSLSPKLHDIMDRGGKIFAHCFGGKGRSGMVLLRLMVERGLDPEHALHQLREVRPGAVETEAQRLWAVNPD